MSAWEQFSELGVVQPHRFICSIGSHSCGSPALHIGQECLLPETQLASWAQLTLMWRGIWAAVGACVVHSLSLVNLCHQYGGVAVNEGLLPPTDDVVIGYVQRNKAQALLT